MNSDSDFITIKLCAGDTVLVFPVLSLWTGSREQKISRGQQVVHYSFYVFIGLMHRLGVMTYKTGGNSL